MAESGEQILKGRDSAVWHVGLKVAWDIETPGLAMPLHQGDCYLMLGNSQELEVNSVENRENYTYFNINYPIFLSVRTFLI